MNKNKIFYYQIFSTIFTLFLGTLLHFTYNLSNNNPIIATFSAVNESTWEHLKLLFFPMLITIFIGCFLFKENKSKILCSKTVGILTAILFTIIFFYTYTGVLGKNIAFIDISIFFIATILGEFIAYKLLLSNFSCCEKIAKTVLILLTFCFIVFTFSTPKIALFKDPLTNKYGIEADRQ